MQRRRGFTLIEMMAVIVVIGLLSTGAVISFSRPLAASRARNSIDQVKSLDSSARQFARTFGKPVEIVFDLSNQTIARRERDQIVFQTTLSRGVRIEEVRFATRSESIGEVSIESSSAGLSRSYAVHLVGPQLDQWLIFAGLSGQVTVINDVSQLDTIFPQSASRDDAD
jgi:prepilin-type N-terminal cleavage/methylation domain-containing protein